jgi:hypothetical protein
MDVEDDTPENEEEEWQFEDLSTPETTYSGGGLLQSILEEVTALREGARADRVGLADALKASFAKIDVEIEVLRDHVAALRSELDASNGVIANALTQLLKAVGEDPETEIPAIVERVVAAQGEANVEAVVSALAPALSAIRKSVPTADLARIAVEVSRLRQSLIGPDHR